MKSSKYVLIALVAFVNFIYAQSFYTVEGGSLVKVTRQANGTYQKQDGTTVPNTQEVFVLMNARNAKLPNSIAIGNGAVVYPEGGQGTDGIAIGTNAESHVMTNANHEKIITFNRDPNKLLGGIAIGANTHARISNVELGNRDYRGEIGDFDLSGKINKNILSGIATTVVGDNSYGMGNFQTINGSFNLISKAEDKSTAFVDPFTKVKNMLHNAGAAIQGFGSNINGSLNSIEAKEELSPHSLFAVISGAAVSPTNGFTYSGMGSFL